MSPKTTASENGTFKDDSPEINASSESNPENAPVESAVTTKTRNAKPQKESQKKMDVKDKVPVQDKPRGIQLYRQGGLPNNRPIGASTLEISETITLSGNRPVEVSHFKVADTLSSSGKRPIAASTMQVAHTLSVSGNRPIAASTLTIYDCLMGNRPIADNDDSDESSSLMGFLD